MTSTRLVRAFLPCGDNAVKSLMGGGAAWLFHLVNGIASLLIVRFPSGIDERQHLSFIRTMAAHASLFPRYEQLRVLDDAGVFTATPNYLNHPAPYYLVMAIIDRLTDGSILSLRLANLGLSLTAVTVLIAGGFRILSDWRERTLYALAVVLFPKLGVLAGLINNDNAALLAIAVAFLGLVRWQQAPSYATAALLAVGIALCGWTKLTALVMIGATVLIAETLRWAVRTANPKRLAYLIVASGFIAASMPSIVNFARYGQLLFVVWRPHDHVPGVERMSFVAYAAQFFDRMWTDWAAVDPASIAQGFTLLGVVALTVAALVHARRDLRSTSARVAMAMVAATVPALILHLAFGWKTYLTHGEISSGLMRYYYGVWPGFALSLTLLWRYAAGTFWRTPATVATGLFLFLCSPMFMESAAALRGHVIA